MENTGSTIEMLMHYQKKYGKRRAESWSDWILKKRAINTAVQIISQVNKLSFEEFEQCLYFRCDDEQLRPFQKNYEREMEEAVLRPEEFVQRLDMFYRKSSEFIEDKHLFQRFFDFSELVANQRRIKIEKNRGYKDVYDAYLSLLMQQTMYFCRDKIDHSVIGISEKGELIFARNPHPYVDIGAYELEKKLIHASSRRLNISKKEIHDAFKPYGYDVYSFEEAHIWEKVARVFDNNIYSMIPYISERTKDIMIQEPYRHYIPEFPRVYWNTELYREKLLHRNYMLPASGIAASYVNAGDIKEIYFAEVLHNGEIVLLYRVLTADNGEYSGYYHTKSQVFYSIFEYTNRMDWHERVENFILENYVILTCEYEITRKKNYAIRQVDSFEREFHYPYQPLVVFNYKTSTSRKTETKRQYTKKYVKEEYIETLRTRNGYIRRLPAGQKVSDSAVQNARDIGIDLPPGMTYVRAHEFMVYMKFPSSDEK